MHLNSLVLILALVLAGSPGQAAQKKILVVLSGASSLGLKEGGSHSTGYFLSEVVEGVRAFRARGYDVVYATPQGNPAAMDAGSDSAQWFSNEAAYHEAKALMARETGLGHPESFSRFSEPELSGFAGVYVPGGYAPMIDLPESPVLGKILRHFHARRAPTALVCHGPIALLAAGETYRGYQVTIVSRAEEQEEERAGHLSGHQLYYVEDALRQRGLRVLVDKPWTPHVVRDREVVTGQNPMSAPALVDAFVKAIETTSRGLPPASPSALPAGS